MHGVEAGGTTDFFVTPKEFPLQLEFVVPSDDPLDLILDCRLTAGGPGPVSLRLESTNGQAPASEREFQIGGHPLRLPLEHLPPRGSISELTLALASPLPSGTATADPPPGQAAFTCNRFSVLPRAVLDLGSFFEELDLRRRAVEEGAFRVSPLHSYSFPAPPDRSPRLALHNLEIPRGCALEVGFENDGARQSIDRTPPSGSAVIELSAPNRLSTLRIRAQSIQASGCSSREPIKFTADDTSSFLTSFGNRKPPPARPNLLLIVLDTLRADALVDLETGAALGPGARELARSGAVFTNVWAPATWTLPSVASLFTGLLPHEHGVTRGDRGLATVQSATAAELLRAAGYRTFAASQSQIISSDFGFDRGFDRFVQTIQLNGRELRSQDLRSLLLAWLASPGDSEKPFFAYLHAVDTHGPYTPPAGHRAHFEALHLPAVDIRTYSQSLLQSGRSPAAPIDRARLSALYLDEAFFFDLQLQRLLGELSALDLLQNTVVILTSDHGEELGEHGGLGHGRTLYEEQVRVPLIVRSIGADKPLVVRERVSLLDLFPTLVELANAEIPSTTRGRSLVPLLAGKQITPAPVFSEVNPVANRDLAEVDLFAAALGDAKCIFNAKGRDQFGAASPREIYARIAAASLAERTDGLDGPIRDACRRPLAGFMASALAARRQDTTKDDRTSKELLQQLRALGYVR
ncbi:MAG: sulfatase [Thermoanaerobaculia bacterium]